MLTDHSMSDPVMGKIQRTATIGIWLSTGAVAVALTVIFYFLATAFSDSDMLARELSAQLDLDPALTQLPTSHAVLAAALWLVMDVIGVVLLMTVRQLFVGIKTIGIFTPQSALQLRRIGWMLFALGPVSIILNALTGTLMQYWANPNSLSIEIALEDTDVYAIVIGLVIVAVAHIMVSAAQLSEDHKAIV